MTPQELKNSVLFLAVQGKLVEQKENEVLKIVGDNWNLDEEEPFNIPETWRWKRFNFFGRLRMGKTILKNQLVDQGIPVYSATQTDSVLGFLKSVELELHRGDLVIPARGNSIGFVTLIRDKIATCTQTTICVTELHDILPEYLYYCCYAFKSSWFKYSGSAIPQVTVTQISKFMVPLPPLSEQKRIVAKLEELLPLIDRYGEAWSALEEFNTRFPTDMQKSILQTAIEGKLVEQRPEEGTGEDLYRAIQKEKAKLVADGLIKKEKPLPEISDEEKPFEIPEGWRWCRLGEIISLLSGQDMQPNCYNSEERGIPYLTGASNIDDSGSVIINRWTDCPKAIANQGALLLTCKGTVGKTAILKEKEVHIARQIMAITPITVDVLYVKYFIASKIKELKSQAKSMIPGIERVNVLKQLLPLPPLSEQKRIVAKLEELLPLCQKVHA